MQITKRPLFYWILYKHRGLQLFLLLIIVVSLFFKVYPLEMQRNIINIAINLKKLDLLFLYCGLYLGAVVIAGLMKYYINTLQAIIGEKILIGMREGLYSHILKLPLQFFHRTQTGIIISAMTAELNAIGSFLGGAIAIPVASFLTFATFLGYMIYLNPTLGFLTMLIYPFEFIVIPLLQKRNNRLNRIRVKITRSMANLVNESVSGIHEVQGNSAIQVEKNKLNEYVAKLYKTMRKLYIVKYGIKFSNNFFQSLGPFLLFLVGGYLAIHGNFTIGALVAFLSAYEKVYDPWKEIIEYYQMYQDSQVRYKQIIDSFDLEETIFLESPLKKEVRLQGNITARGLGFRINNDIRLLEDVSFDLSAGSHLALIGFSGSGKSTLSHLVGQLLQYSEGSLQIDGYEIKELGKNDIARNISTVSQHPFIFTGTVRDNLLYACEALRLNDTLYSTPDRTELIAIVREVGLEEDVLRWGFRSVIPREKATLMAKKFLLMRSIIHTTLRHEFEKAVEFYDADAFLEYSTIAKNILFGEYLSDPSVSSLINNRKFRLFLKKEGLEKTLLDLGKGIAEATVTLLYNMREDEFFFQGSPMVPEQFESYVKLVDKLKSIAPDRLRDKEKNEILLLALFYIPGIHKIFTIPDTLRRTILRARHTFLEDIENINIELCKSGTIQKEIVPMSKTIFTREEKHNDFIPLCSSQYLYNQTLLSNVIFGTVIDRDTIKAKVAELALTHFSEQDLLDEILEIGLDFHVGSKGDNLSGGQKQKIALARSLLKRTPILILDEATASLDNRSQARIQKYIEGRLKGNTTVIAVVHRLDMISGYDHILVMKDGRIHESGTYEELLKEKGVLYELINES